MAYEPIDPAKQAAKEAPFDGANFLGGWTFQGNWVTRICQWRDYEKTFYQVPGNHVAPVTHWQPEPEGPSV